MELIKNSLYIYDYFMEGNGYSNGQVKAKAPKNKKHYLNFNDIECEDYILGHIKENIIMLDIDDPEQANILYEIIKDLNIKCIVKETTRGKHFYFKYENKGIDNNKNKNEYLAIGLKGEHKLGMSNTRTLVKDNGVYRNILRVCNETEMSQLPVWLYPIGKKDPQLLELTEGDGRNQSLYNHILRLVSIGLYKNNGGLECMELINKYILQDSLNSDEFETITRDEAWKNKNFPFVDDKGKPLQVWENLQYILETNKISAKYNVINKEIEFSGVNGKLDYDSIITEFNTLCRIRGLKLNKDHLYDYTLRIAMENQYNPVKEYLLKSMDAWDGKDRIHDLYNTLIKVDDTEFQYLLFHKWLLNCVAMAFNTGNTQQQGILVVQGAQGIGKTRWIRSISPYDKWVVDSLQVDPNNKDSVMKVTRNWLVELGEIEGMTSKKEQAALKAFITSPSDYIRLPYTRTTKEYVRYSCYYASVNDSEFLKDDTGNRRYWVIKVKEMVCDHGIDISQLWGQVTKEFLVDKVSYWLNAEEKTILNEVNEEFRIISPVEQKLRDGFNWDEKPLKWDWKQASEMAYILDIPNNMVNQIGKTLSKMGVESKRMNRGKFYKTPTFKNICSKYKLG